MMMNELTVLEALTTVKKHPLAEIKDAFQVWRHTGLQFYERVYVRDAALEYLGRSYGPLKLGLHALDGLIHKAIGKDVFLFRRMALMKPYPICSWVVTWAYFNGANYQFSVHPNHADPDHIHDHVTQSGHWEMVYEQGATK